MIRKLNSIGDKIWKLYNWYAIKDSQQCLRPVPNDWLPPLYRIYDLIVVGFCVVQCVDMHQYLLSYLAVVFM